VFLREAYLQRRLNLLYDGNLPGGPTSGSGSPRRKTLKEMEEEFLEEERTPTPGAPAAPAKEGAAPGGDGAAAAKDGTAPAEDGAAPAEDVADPAQDDAPAH